MCVYIYIFPLRSHYILVVFCFKIIWLYIEKKIDFWNHRILEFGRIIHINLTYLKMKKLRLEEWK